MTDWLLLLSAGASGAHNPPPPSPRLPLPQGNSREPVYCGHLGLAVEQLKDGTSVESLWSVL